MTALTDDLKLSDDNAVRLIAFYLPQYHPIPENDQWWGKGFTEWLNVAKAKPLFPGHYQPHIPADLGFYDLRLPETREAQADLAKQYGISGFCFYHYWFNGKRLLHRVFDEILESGKPDFPFCLCWANENWTRAWDGGDEKILMGQHYSQEDDREHIAWLIRAFRDPRYIKIQGRPLMLIYRTSDLPHPDHTAALWREEVKRAGFPDIYLCIVESFESERIDPRDSGFDGSVEFQPDWLKLGDESERYPGLHVFDYGKIAENMINKTQPEYRRFPCVTPSWDNSPRRAHDGYIFHGSSPVMYERWLRHAVSLSQANNPEERIVFINAWNEWGEGNHIEPDLRNGHAYLLATKRALTIDPEHAGINKELTERAVIAMNEGRLEESEALFSEALSNDPGGSQTLYQYALLQNAKGNTAGSFEILEKALRADPANAEIINDLGTLCYQEGQTDRAISLFNQAIATDPDLTAARMNLADLYAVAGQTEKAGKIYKEILSLKPGNAEAYAALVSLTGSVELQNAPPACSDSPLCRKKTMTRTDHHTVPNDPISCVAQESLRMKRDWNARAEENSRYYIHSTNMDQSEEDFDASGKHNVQTIIVNDLATIAGGADPKTMVALEIGCGIGRMTKHLASVFKEIHGVDVSGEMILQAKSRLEYLPNAYCYETSGTDLSIFADGMFDFVFSFIVFQHIPSKEVILNYLREAHRVLKTGGVFKFQVQGCTDPQWMRAEKDTWHGVTITEEDVDGISIELGFDLMVKSGQGTQYSWYTLKKSGVVAKSKKPLLASIVIPVYNQLEYTRQCLDALGKNTPEDLYELIVVDNNSTDGTHEYLSKITGSVKIITNRENMGFTIACNQGAKAAQGRYLVFLNNDTIPLDGWLTSLLDTFKLGDDIGAVGSKLIYPDTRLQEAGGIIFSDGNGWNFGRGDSPDFGRYNKLIEVDYCSGASLAVRKDLFDELGGFDEIYAPAYYEDTDLCFSLREKGYRILYQPESEIIHCEGKTAGSDTGSGFKKYQVINHQKFIKKWEHRLKDQGPSPYKGAPKPFTADRKRRLAGYTHNNKINTFDNSVTADSAETINFLIIDPFLPIYDKASGSFRLFQIVKILANTPHVHITYLARHGHHGDKYIKLLTSMGVEVHHTDPEKLFSFDIFVQKLSLNMKYILAQKKYHYAYLSFYEIALQYLAEIRLYSPESKIIIDTVDIHFLREMRQAELYDDNDLMKKAHNTKENELDIYKRADALVTVTDQDADVIRPYFPQKPIYIIPNIHPVEKGKLSFQDRSGIIFIGNYYHPPNVDAVEYLLRDIKPKLSKKGLSIPIQIIGDGLPDNVKKLGDKNVLFTGWVPETKPYLENAKISIAPLRYGAGMKGKVGEALAAGLPVITTSIGAEGMGLCHEKDVLIADTADDFADAIIQLYKNESLWTTLQENGIEFIEKNYSIAAVQKNVQKIFNLSEAQLHKEDTSSAEKSKITSIIIPCFNQLEYSKKCLESIFKHTRDNYELILVDNGSKDGTRHYISKLAKDHENVQIILNDENLGFAAANNQGLVKAKGDYILLLNNDVVVTEGWLERLISHLEQFPDIGMVGPMSNSVSGDQLVKKVPYKNKLNDMHKFAREFTKNNYGKVTEIMRLVGFCLLIKKEVLEVIGGLDENYGSGNFEDDDLCLRSYIAGYKNVIAGDVFIHHYGSMTFKGNSIDYKATMNKNLSYFGEKWKDIIKVHDTGYKIHLTREHQIQKLISWGEEKYASGDLRSAVKIFERVMKLDRRNSQALSNLGVIQWQLGETISAVGIFQKSLFLNPNDADALANLVQAVEELKRNDLVQYNLIDLLRQSQPANPDFKKLIEIRGQALNAR